MLKLCNTFLQKFLLRAKKFSGLNVVGRAPNMFFALAILTFARLRAHQ